MRVLELKLLDRSCEFFDLIGIETRGGVEAVYLHELADGLKARRVIGEWIGFYTTERPHSACALAG